jgi:hypothetical protein
MTVQPRADSGDIVFNVERGALEGRLVRHVTREADELVVDFTAEIDGLPHTCGMSHVAIYDGDTLDDLVAVVADLRRQYQRVSSTGE